MIQQRSKGLFNTDVLGRIVPALSLIVGFTKITQTVTMLDQYLITHIGCENFAEILRGETKQPQTQKWFGDASLSS